MGNGTTILLSDRITELHNKVFANQPKYKHFTIHNRYLAAVIERPKPSILIYEFSRSTKPLLRTVQDDDGNLRAIIRDYFRIEDGLWVLGHLERIVASQVKKGSAPDQGVCREEYKETTPTSIETLVV